MNPSTQPSALPEGVWQTLLAHAFTLLDEIGRRGISDPFWTFGGGTALMLRHGHRLSKDIDIFVPDPQYLGFVSPRLSDAVERVSADSVEGPGYGQGKTRTPYEFAVRVRIVSALQGTQYDGHTPNGQLHQASSA